MSGVDVLAVMDALGSFDIVTRGELSEARAAVAELIEAVYDVYGTGPEDSCATPCPSCRIQAALARCTGGTK